MVTGYCHGDCQWGQLMNLLYNQTIHGIYFITYDITGWIEILCILYNEGCIS